MRFSRSFVVALLLTTAGCRAAVGELTARAAAEWMRSYPLSAGGQLQITNVNGRIEIEGVEGSTVEVRAERVARGATESVARELLPRITIKEDIQPDKVSLETGRISGILIGASFSVDYHVRAPRSVMVHARTTNGPVEVQALTGRVVINTVNGPINGRDLSGGVEARTVNGPLNIALSSVGEDLIDLRTTNGPLQLALPEKTKANLSASTVNGPIETAGLTLDLMGEQSRRRVRGRLNGGGTPIELNTVNGRIEVTPR
jgi:hypothetical protein